MLLSLDDLFRLYFEFKMEKNDAMNFENIQIFLESHRSNEQSQKTVDELNNLLKRLQTENAQVKSQLLR